jgi:hypothetical protein
MKTNELNGAALDWAVAKCKYPELVWGSSIGIHHASHQIVIPHLPEPQCYWNPSTNWAQGGPIIEREMIQLTPKCMVNPLHGWAAAYRSFDEDDDIYALHRMRGKTPLIAAMRCYVASKLGDTVDVPPELV